MNKTQQLWEKRGKIYKSDIRGVLFGKKYPAFVIEWFDRWTVNKLLQAITKKKQTRVLDLGCGYGRVSGQIIKARPLVKVSGVDLSTTYVDIYNKTISPHGKAIVADIQKLPFKSNSFDISFMIATLMYLPDTENQRKAVEEIVRVTKDKGSFVLIERTPMMQLFDFHNAHAKTKMSQISFSSEDINELVRSNAVIQHISYWPSKVLPLFISYTMTLDKRKKRDRFTEQFKKDLTYDVRSRRQKAKKIVAVLQDHLGETSKLKCLDLGSSTGLIAENLSHYFGSVVGVDVDEHAIETARKRVKRKNVAFKLSNETTLPFKANSFDAVVFNQVYEHTQDPLVLMKEVRRVLKKGGVCFLGARNRYGGPFDGHYSLPFLAWLPRNISNIYVSLFAGKREYDVRLFSLSEIEGLADGFKKIDYTLAVIKNPGKFNALDVLPKSYIAQKGLLYASYVLYRFIPNYIWVLEK